MAAARRRCRAHAYVVDRHARPHATISRRCARSPPRDLRYLGLIGSRAKVARIFDALVAEGMPAECLERVHAPIGLDIGAVTPQEIAVSILAELIAVTHGKDTADVDERIASVTVTTDRASRTRRPAAAS